jgi:DNA-binding protein
MKRSRKMPLLRHVLARVVASPTGSTAIDLGEAVVVATMTMIGIITGGGAIGSGARVQTVLESRRWVLLIAGVDVIQTDTDRERGVTEVVLQARGSTTAIRIERGNLVKTRPKRNVDVKETSQGSTETELGLLMPLTQNLAKIELRRTLMFYRKALAIPLL